MMKQFEATTKTIGGNTYYIRPLPAFKASNIFGELAAVITPLLGALAPLIDGGAGTDSKGLMDIEVEKAAPAIAGAFSSLSGDAVEKLLKKLLIEGKNISVDIEGETEAQLLTQDRADELFCGDAQDMFILAFEVIRVNFGGFFRKLDGLSGNAKALLEKLSSTENTGS